MKKDIELTLNFTEIIKFQYKYAPCTIGAILILKLYSLFKFKVLWTRCVLSGNVFPCQITIALTLSFIILLLLFIIYHMYVYC